MSSQTDLQNAITEQRRLQDERRDAAVRRLLNPHDEHPYNTAHDELRRTELANLEEARIIAESNNGHHPPEPIIFTNDNQRNSQNRAWDREVRDNGTEAARVRLHEIEASRREARILDQQQRQEIADLRRVQEAELRGEGREVTEQIIREHNARRNRSAGGKYRRTRKTKLRKRMMKKTKRRRKYKRVKG